MKYIFKYKDEVGMMININMRCIEMGSSVLLNMCLCQININMRCIEITISKPFTLIV